MIRIRYRDSNELSPGLHAAAERHGRTTTLYLLSGLTVPERRSALRRLRLSARMGHCPRLPAAQLALALLADWIRTVIGRAGAVFRLHPAGSTVPVMVLSGGAVAFLLLSPVSIRVLHSQRTDTQSSAAGPSPAAPAGEMPISGAPHGRAAGLAGPGDPDDLAQGSDSRQLTQRGPGGGSSPPGLAGAGGGQGSGGHGSGGQGSGGQGSGAGGADGGTTLMGRPDPTPASAPRGAAAGRTPAPAVTPARGTAARSPEPAASTTPGSGGICVHVGSLGVCLII